MNFEDLIGNTPLRPIQVALPVYQGYRQHHLNLKLEGYNPGGSIKDRTALALINDVEARGLLKAGGNVVESTSGNTGAANAVICRERGYQFHAVVDPKTTAENLQKMRNFGACIEMVTQLDVTGGYLLNRLKRVEELIMTLPNAVWPNQYENEANVRAHYSTTGPEIYKQMHGAIDAIFIAVSTGGTLAGTGRYLSEKLPDIRVYAVDAQGSIALGGRSGKRLLTGIGASRPSTFVRRSDYNAVGYVNDVEAFACCRALWKTVGLRVGGSSGAVIATMIAWLSDRRDRPRVVGLCADKGENYLSTIFCDSYVRENLPHVLNREKYYTSIFLPRTEE